MHVPWQSGNSNFKDSVQFLVNHHKVKLRLVCCQLTENMFKLPKLCPSRTSPDHPRESKKVSAACRLSPDLRATIRKMDLRGSRSAICSLRTLKSGVGRRRDVPVVVVASPGPRGGGTCTACCPSLPSFLLVHTQHFERCILRSLNILSRHFATSQPPSESER